MDCRSHLRHSATAAQSQGRHQVVHEVRIRFTGSGDFGSSFGCALFPFWLARLRFCWLSYASFESYNMWICLELSQELLESSLTHRCKLGQPYLLLNHLLVGCSTFDISIILGIPGVGMS